MYNNADLKLQENGTEEVTYTLFGEIFNFFAGWKCHHPELSNKQHVVRCLYVLALASRYDASS